MHCVSYYCIAECVACLLVMLAAVIRCSLRYWDEVACCTAEQVNMPTSEPC